MPEPSRTIEQVRTEIATERRLLGEDVETLRADVRAMLPYAAAGLAAYMVLTKGRGAARAYKLWRLLR